MFTAFMVTLLLVVFGGFALLSMLVVGVLKLAFKLVGLVLGFGLLVAGGAFFFALAVGLGLALLVPLLPLLALIALIWLIVAATRPAPVPALTYAPRH